MYITKEFQERGAEGAIAHLLQKNDVPYEALSLLQNAPADCPWYAQREMTVSDAIGAIFEPLRWAWRNAIEEFQANCKYLLHLKVDGVHYLLYVMWMWETEYELWVGGEPNPNATADAEMQAADWALPKPLADFYTVHNGFGVIDGLSGHNFEKKLWNSCCVSPAHQLWLMNWSTHNEDWDPVYKPNDILFFYHDGGGDYVGFARPFTDEDNGKLVSYWDTMYYNHEEDCMYRTGHFPEEFGSTFADKFH